MGKIVFYNLNIGVLSMEKYLDLMNGKGGIVLTAFRSVIFLLPPRATSPMSI